MRYIATLIALVAVAGIASAAMTGGWSVNAEGTTAMPNHTVNDLVINTTLDWTSAIVSVNAPGAIYQDSFEATDPITGGPLPPPANFLAMVPSLEWDTYICGGQFSDKDPAPAGTAGATASYTLPPNPICDVNDVLATFFTTTTTDIGIIELTRVTVSSAFTGGSWSIAIYDASSAEAPVLEATGTIVEGVLVPEPATMLIMAIGGIGVLARRRRK